MCLTLSHIHTETLALSLSLSRSLFLAHTHTLSLSLSLVLSQTLELPEAAYTTQHGGRMCLGLGDFKVDLNEVNLVAEI